MRSGPAEAEGSTTTAGRSGGAELSTVTAHITSSRLRGTWWVGPAIIIVILGAWQLCAFTRVVDPSITSDPWDILREGAKFYGTSTSLTDLGTSAVEVFWGLLLAIAVGVAVGTVAGMGRMVGAAVDPLVAALYAIPMLALAPLFIVWFGIGSLSKIAVVFLLAVFPVIINTEAGIRTVDISLVNVARSLGAKRLFIIRKIVIPSSVPHILSGVRLAIAAALIGMVVGEIIASTSGIGYVIEGAASTVNTSLLFVGVFTISIAALILRWAVQLVERRVARWRV